MAIPGASRDAIRRQFGEPYVLSQDGQAMAFLKQETAERKILTLAVVVPFWSKASVTYFQVQGIWFDAEGKVVKTKLWEGHDGPHGGNPYESYRVPTRQHVLLWLGQEAPASSK